MNIENKRFTESEKQIIQQYVLQGMQNGESLSLIKERIDADGKVVVSYPYVAYMARKIRQELAGKQENLTKGGRRYTEAEKKIAFEYIEKGLAERLSGDAIREKLLSEKNLDVSHSRIYDFIKEYREMQPKKERKTFQTPAERLYYERAKIIDLRNRGYTYEDIADVYHVAVSDVEEFFSKRKYVRPEQYREIVYKSSRGATPEELADEYDLNVNTVRKILISKQRAISSEIEDDEETQQELDLNVARNFIKFINTLMTYKEIRSDLADRLNAERLDILHELEMKELSQEEKLAMLDKIAELGRQRREEKDYNEIFAPVTEFLADEDNMNLIKVFANRVAEAVNKVKDLDTRVYFLRGSGE